VCGADPGVAEPAGEVAYLALDEEFDAVAATLAAVDEVLPVLTATEEGGAVLVLNEVVHVLVVGLDRELGNTGEGVVDTQSHLVGGHGIHTVGHRHPEVGGQGDAGGGEEVHILRHAGIACFDRKVGRDEHTSGEAWLDGTIGGVMNAEGTEVETIVEFDSLGDGPVVLDIADKLVGGNGAGHDAGVDLQGLVHLDGIEVVDAGVGHLGREPVARGVDAELDGMLGRGRIIEVRAQRHLANARIVVAGHGGGLGIIRHGHFLH